jgi:hypothetical protein
MHEQSETIQRDGKFYNVYGKGTPKAGQDLPDSPAYDTLDAAVAAAKLRSETAPKQGIIDRAIGTSPEAIRAGARQLLGPDIPVKYKPTGY